MPKNEVEKKETTKTKNNEKKLKDKIKEIEAYGKVINKKTGSWQYIDKNGKTSEIVFNKNDKSFEIKQKENDEYAMLARKAIAIADVDELSLITQILNDPESFLTKFRTFDYVERPSEVQKCFMVCCSVIELQKKECIKNGNKGRAALDIALNKIKANYFRTMKKALHIRQHKIHYAVHSLDDETLCVDPCSDGKPKHPHSLCLECDEKNGCSATLFGDCNIKVPVDNLEDLGGLTKSIRATKSVENFLSLNEYKKRPSFVEAAFDLIDESLNRDKEVSTDNNEITKINTSKEGLRNYRKTLEQSLASGGMTLS